MDQRPLTPSAPRALRVGLVIALSLASVSIGAGCHKRRSAMRPVIISPSDSVEVRTVPSSSETLIESEPSLRGGSAPQVELNAPDKEPELAPTRGNELEVRPTAPSGRKLTPSKQTPPAPTDLDEPQLSLPDPEKPKSPATGAGAKPGISFPDLNAPGAGTSETTPKSAFGDIRSSQPRVRQVSNLRERVRPWVNDPDDLFAPPKADRPWKYIVIHHSANASGSYAQIDREHRKIQGWDGCGYHFVIGNGTESPNGQIEVSRRWANQKQGLHCRNGKYPDINEYGIGICMIGDFDETAPSAKQMEAVKALVAYLSERYKIPADRIGTHAQMASTSTACPGENFPTNELIAKPGFAAR